MRVARYEDLPADPTAAFGATVRSAHLDRARALRARPGRCFRFYNAKSRHQGPGRRTPDEMYAGSGSWPNAA